MTRSKMDMEPSEIRVALLRAGTSQVTIARKLEVTPGAITRVIDGDSASDRIRKAIAEAINTDVRAIWPSTYIIHGGPRKPGRPKAA